VSIIRHIPVCIIALFSCINLAAGDYSVGSFQSPKGIGLSVEYDTRGVILNSYTLYADLYGIPTGKYGKPGVKFVFTHYNLLGEIESDDISTGFWIGPGMSLGCVRDFGKEGRFCNCATVNCAAAVRFEYLRRLNVEIGFNLELGICGLRNGSDYEISIYNNGIRESWYPHIKLMYQF